METLDPRKRDEYMIDRLRNSDTPVSGEAIASELGLSRVALWKRVEILKSWGYLIESSTRGYRLERDDGLAAWDIAVPGEVFLHDELPSTMDEARLRANGGAASGSLVLANRQLAGRGRAGKSWNSPDGGLYFTAIVRPPMPVTYSGAVVLEAASILLSVLSEGRSDALRFRWPNDVMLGGDKLGGILVESHGSLDRPDFFLVGIGLNFRPVKVSGRNVASVADLAEDPPRRASVAAEIATRLHEWSLSPTLDGGAWASLLPNGKNKITATMWDGSTVEGSPYGFTPRGDLRLDKGKLSLCLLECRKVFYEGELT